MTFSLQLGPSSDTAVELFPEWNYRFKTEQNRSDMRTPAGKLYKYTYGSYDTFDLDMEYVPSSTASIVNSWFDSNTELLLFVTSGTATDVHSVYIMNDDSPFNEFAEPSVDLWNGSLKLETY